MVDQNRLCRKELTPEGTQQAPGPSGGHQRGLLRGLLSVRYLVFILQVEAQNRSNLLFVFVLQTGPLRPGFYSATQATIVPVVNDLIA